MRREPSSNPSYCIELVGTSGSGKTTLAVELARRLAVHHGVQSRLQHATTFPSLVVGAVRALPALLAWCRALARTNRQALLQLNLVRGLARSLVHTCAPRKPGSVVLLDEGVLQRLRAIRRHLDEDVSLQDLLEGSSAERMFPGTPKLVVLLHVDAHTRATRLQHRDRARPVETDADLERTYARTLQDLRDLAAVQDGLEVCSLRNHSWAVMDELCQHILRLSRLDLPPEAGHLG